MSAFIHSIKTKEDLAKALGVSEERLNYVLFVRSTSGLYRSWEIPTKAGGTRTIHAPGTPLRDWQKLIAGWVDELYIPRHSTHGYVATRSIATNALPHVGRRFVFNVDLEGFFPTLHFGRVAGVLASKPFDMPPAVANVVAQICCLDSRLPIGAPSSPVLSNVICSRLDGALQKLAGRWNCTYTRYSDDITFSTNRQHFPNKIGGVKYDGEVFVGSHLAEIIASNGFSVNPAKTRLQSDGMAQRVTGLKVNEKLNVDRRYIRKIRAILHSLETLGEDGAQTKFDAVTASGHRYPGATPQATEVVEGMIAFAAMVRGPSDPLVIRLRAQLENIRAGRPRTDGRGAPPPDADGKKAVRILHLSDLHFRDKTAWDAAPVLRSLSEALEAQWAGDLDLVVVTGDVAFSGRGSEYAVAEEWFRDLASRLALPHDRFLFVAGNHDVARADVASTQRQFRGELVSQSEAGQPLRDLLDKPSERAVFLQQFDEFLAFVERFSGEGDPELWWMKRFDLRGTIVDVMGLCSALLSGADQEQGRLLLGLPIVNELIDQGSPDADMRLTLLHHPFTYITENDRSAIVEVETWSDIVLRGHWHEEDQLVSQGQGRKHAVLAGGCVYESSQYTNSVQRIDIDIVSSVARLQVLRWERRRWIESLDATKDWDPPHQISF